MFMGEYHHTIDDKGRITIPSKLRYELGEQFVVTKGLDGCLFIYPKDEWDNITKKYKELPNTKDARNYLRFFLLTQGGSTTINVPVLCNSPVSFCPVPAVRSTRQTLAVC